MLDPMALNLLLNQEILTFGLFMDKCYGHNEAFVVQKKRPCVQSLLTVGLLLKGHIWCHRHHSLTLVTSRCSRKPKKRKEKSETKGRKRKSKKYFSDDELEDDDDDDM